MKNNKLTKIKSPYRWMDLPQAPNLTFQQRCQLSGKTFWKFIAFAHFIVKGLLKIVAVVGGFFLLSAVMFGATKLVGHLYEHYRFIIYINVMNLIIVVLGAIIWTIYQEYSENTQRELREALKETKSLNDDNQDNT